MRVLTFGLDFHLIRRGRRPWNPVGHPVQLIIHLHELDRRGDPRALVRVTHPKRREESPGTD